MRLLPLLGVVIVALALASSAAAGEPRLREVVTGLDSPTHVSAPLGRKAPIYVVERGGTIRIVRRGRVEPGLFLDIRTLVKSGGEQGLFSIAFHPDYWENHRFFTAYTNTSGDTVVVELRSDGKRALPGTRRQLLLLEEPESNHNGGQLAFGPDGLLYLGMGDGGGDPEGRPQSLESLRGKILRLDVDAPGAEPEIVAYGLRNPWRFSFDRTTGDLWVGDVGQDAWEEIDLIRAASVGSPVNFGWEAYEGFEVFSDRPVNPAGELAFPELVYGHDQGCSVTGGFVYRGAGVPAAVGRYFYGDFCSGAVWSVDAAAPAGVAPRREQVSAPLLTSFGENARGELLLVTLSGTLYRLVA